MTRRRASLFLFIKISGRKRRLERPLERIAAHRLFDTLHFSRIETFGGNFLHGHFALYQANKNLIEQLIAYPQDLSSS